MIATRRSHPRPHLLLLAGTLLLGWLAAGTALAQGLSCSGRGRVARLRPHRHPER